MSQQTGFTVTLDDKELNRQIEQAIKRNPKATTKAVKECLLDLAGDSSRRAPVDTGDLRGDCTAELNGSTIFTKQAPTGIAPSALNASGTVSYGLPYALRQHEELDYNHPRGGEAKYLERPFEEHKADFIKRMEKVPEEIIDG